MCYKNVIYFILFTVASLFILIINLETPKQSNDILSITDYFSVDEDPKHSSDVCIAILDTGIGNSECISTNLLCFEDFVNHRPKPYDDNGHGTKICSILFGIDGAILYYQGINPTLNCISLKIADHNGEITYMAFDNALDWLIKNHSQYGVDIVLMPLGFDLSPSLSFGLEKKIQSLMDENILVVSSSGNNGFRDKVTFPGSIKGVVTVGSIDNTNATPDIRNSPVCDFSNSSISLDKPDLFAPGKNILAFNHKLEPEIVSGTSYSAAIVAAHIATYIQFNPHIDYSNLFELPVVSHKIFVGQGD